MTQPQVAGVLNEDSVKVLQPGQFVPGLQGLKLGSRAPAPGGPAHFHMFTPEGQRRAVPPMKRPEITAVIERTRSWWASFVEKTQNRSLADDEEPPMLLVLIVVMHHTREPAKNDALQCMKNVLIPIATSTRVVVQWENQEFESVPWEVRRFPIGAATLLLERCRTVMWSDQLWWDQRSSKFVQALRPDDERIQIGFLPFREPTEEELAAQRTPELAAPANVRMNGAGPGDLWVACGGASVKSRPKGPEAGAGGTSVPPGGNQAGAGHPTSTLPPV